jgi:hypothetical protein
MLKSGNFCHLSTHTAATRFSWSVGVLECVSISFARPLVTLDAGIKSVFSRSLPYCKNPLTL